MLLRRLLLYVALALVFATTVCVVFAEVDASSAAEVKQAELAEQALHSAVESAAKLQAAVPESAQSKQSQKDASSLAAASNSTAVLSVKQELEALARNQQQLALDTEKLLLLLSQQTGDDEAVDADVRKGLAAMKVTFKNFSVHVEAHIACPSRAAQGGCCLVEASVIHAIASNVVHHICRELC
jgi:hypothetical protein